MAKILGNIGILGVIALGIYLMKIMGDPSTSESVAQERDAASLTLIPLTFLAVVGVIKVAEYFDSRS